MGQRQSATSEPKTKSPFKYGGSVEGVMQCEIENDQHEVEPPYWPPRPAAGAVTPGVGFQYLNASEVPSMSLPCRLCGCTVIVYSGHASGALKGVKVILPKDAAS